VVVGAALALGAASEGVGVAGALPHGEGLFSLAGEGVAATGGEGEGIGEAEAPAEGVSAAAWGGEGVALGQVLPLAQSDADS
jgi:hypothetical protein